MAQNSKSRELELLERLLEAVEIKQMAAIERIESIMGKNQSDMTAWLMLLTRDLREVRLHFTPERKALSIPKGSPLHGRALLDELRRGKPLLDELRREHAVIGEALGEESDRGEADARGEEG